MWNGECRTSGMLVPVKIVVESRWDHIVGRLVYRAAATVGGQEYHFFAESEAAAVEGVHGKLRDL